MKNIVVTFLFFCVLTAHAQNNRLWGGIEVGYGYEYNFVLIPLKDRTG